MKKKRRFLKKKELKYLLFIQQEGNIFNITARKITSYTLITYIKQAQNTLFKCRHNMYIRINEVEYVRS